MMGLTSLERYSMSARKITNEWGVPEGCLINGKWLSTAQSFDVLDKYSGKVVATVDAADREMVATAISGLAQAMRAGVPAPHDRAQVLRRAALELEAQRERMAGVM